MRCIIALLSFIFAYSNSLAQSWHFIAPMKKERSECMAFQLPTGKILVVGGRDAFVALSNCEMYDPSTNTWTSAGSLNIARFRFRGFSLPDGRVFVAGGLNAPGTSITPTTKTCEIYDPVKDSWKVTAPMTTPREGFLACQLPNGNIALLGGLDANTADYTRTFDIFDWRTESMLSMPRMPSCAAATSAVYNPATSSIVVPGGLGQGYGGYIWKSVQCFSFTTNTWSLLDSLHTPQEQPDAAFYNRYDQRVVIWPSTVDYAGTVFTEVQAISTSGEVTSVGDASPRIVPKRLMIEDSALILSGIHVSKDVWNGTLLASCEWFDLHTSQIYAGPRLLEAMQDEAVLYFKKGLEGEPCRDTKVAYVFGGLTDSGITNRSEALTIANGGRLRVCASYDTLTLTQSECDSSTHLLTFLAHSCDSITFEGLYIGELTALPCSLNAHTNVADGTVLLSFRAANTDLRVDSGLTARFATRNDTVAVHFVVLSSGSAALTLQLPSELRFTATPCSALDTVIDLSNYGCFDISIQSVASVGQGLELVHCDSVIAPGTTGHLRLRSAPSAQGTTFSEVRLTGTQGNFRFDTTIAASLTVESARAIPFRAFIADPPVSTIGDTVTIPVWIYTELDSLSGMYATISYNTDLLSMIAPQIEGSDLATCGPFALKERAGFALLEVPGTVLFSKSQPFAKLRLRTMLSDSVSSDVTVTSLSAESLPQTACISLVSPSAVVRTQFRCGDQELFAFLRADSVSDFKLWSESGALYLSYSRTDVPTEVRIFDALGRPVFQHTAESTGTILKYSPIAAGVYHVMRRVGSAVRTKSVAVIK